MITRIDTAACERFPLSGEGLGEAAEIVGPGRCGAESVRGLLRWIGPSERIDASPIRDSHQLLYIMEGKGVFELEGKEYPAGKGAGVYLAPGEGATLRHDPAEGETPLKAFHIQVPPA